MCSVIARKELADTSYKAHVAGYDNLPRWTGKSAAVAHSRRANFVAPLVIAVLSASGCASSAHTAHPGPSRIDLRWDAGEDDVAFDLIAQAARSAPIATEDWERLRQTEGYRRLAEREKQMGREIRDADFEAFLTSAETQKRASGLRATLDEWRKADLQAAASRVLAYLPDEARIHATVYPVIKPQSNSFVFEPATNPSIFLSIDPAMTRDQFENTVAHELHHIGFASIPEESAQHPARVETVLKWMSAFGEGFAMLAAAGGPDVHPHEHSSVADRERWDRDVASFDADLAKVQTFFIDVLDGRLRSEADVDRVAYSFFGVQGPWYTVGWKMAVVVERRYGRAVLIEGMRRPERLLATYNRAARESMRRGGEPLALWSDELIERVGATPLVQ